MFVAGCISTFLKMLHLKKVFIRTDRQKDRLKTWRQTLMKESGSKACLILAENVSSSESVPTDRQTDRDIKADKKTE